MIRAAPPAADRLDEATFLAIAAIAYEVAGLALPLSKRSMVAARLSRRLTRLAITTFEQYLDVISVPEAPERRRMVAALTTNVSTFFREPHHFERLREDILPPLLTAARAGERVRLWSAGCANGQEAYSIALTILEAAPDAHTLDIRILGTDIDPSVVRFAQLGAYHASMMSGVSGSLKNRFFTFDASANTYVASPALRSLAIFRELNLHGPWPMPGRFDVIFCRNVVIYFDAAGQAMLWRRLQQKLTQRGWLLVGHSERLLPENAQQLELVEHTVYRNCT
ncbi:MAG: protein-glutamate O-methyltransferase CheR [Pseudomonadota bacterium]